MKTDRLRQRLAALLADADIVLNGDHPWDMQVNDERLFRRIWAEGSLGLGEAYMDGWWDCERLDVFFDRVLRAGLDKRVRCWVDVCNHLCARLMNMQSRRRAYKVGEQHYDLGNDLFERMLDERMIYSCGYWREADTVDEAQRAKLDLICRKLKLEPGMRLLDIGCGWGGLLRFAAEEYGVEGVGVTISQEQVAHARKNCQGLPVEVHLQDYRDLNEQFDAVASVGMFEHVGGKNHRRFMEVAESCLLDNGLFLLHSIGQQHSSAGGEPWLTKYIFPNGDLPCARQVAETSEDFFILEDWHNFGPDYDHTLMAWLANVEASWEELPARYDERFRRMWRYYLQSCAGGFRSRTIQLWQVVFSKCGTPGTYHSVR